jgi:transcriptional regulator with XRE-family HTH domain
MRTDFSVFRERLAEACRIRGMSDVAVCRSIGLGSRSTISLSLTGPKSLDLYRVSQIADKLDVSVDWLLGRSNVMDVMEMPELPEPTPTKRKARRA